MKERDRAVRLPPPLPHLLAQLLRLLVGHVDIVEAAEKGGQDDHEDKHEPGRGGVGGSEQASILGEVGLREERDGAQGSQGGKITWLKGAAPSPRLRTALS